MKCSFFSDLHVRNPSDKASELFQMFCDSQEVRDSDQIYLLGDMFDMLIGEHKNHFKKYSQLFESIIDLLDKNKKVIYIEGNHDFHIKNSFLKFIKLNTNNHRNFKYSTEGDCISLNNKTYYYCHGYEVDYNNIYFKRWKRIYTSKAFKIIVSYLIPYFLLVKLGDMASKDSKRRGRKSFDYSKAKAKYIEGAKSVIKEKSVNGVICGHTHIKENIHYDDGTHYINNGFPLKDKCFTHFDGNELLIVSLEESSQ